MIKIEPVVREGQLKNNDSVLIEFKDGNVVASRVTYVCDIDYREQVWFAFLHENDIYTDEIGEEESNIKNISIVNKGVW